MKKTIHFVVRARNACLLHKLLLIMRLTTFLILFTVIQVAGIESYSQETKISLNLKSTSLKDVLETIEDESNFYFLYSAAMIDVGRKVDVSIENGNITEILDEVLKNTGIRYVIKGRQILLTEKNKTVVGGESIQQQRSVSGKVTDSSGAALPGVTVVIKNTTNVTITDVNGNYTITGVGPAGVLVFSFVGMKTQEIPTSGKSTINVILADESIGLEEVVAVGYGTQRKATLTGAISNITADEIKVTTQSNLTNTMSGKLPGLRVVQRTSEPGRYENYFDIRGYGSPLVVVDGIVREDYSKIDPNEVESISILKDASAAVYGVKAADGVVLITTKKGDSVKTKFNYSGTYGWADITSTPEVGNAVDWMTLTNEQIQNDNIVNRTSKALSYSAEDIEQYASGTKKSTDWQNLALRDFAPQQQHNLNINGGTEKVRYFLSFGYFDEMGLWKSGDLNYNRYNFRSNLNIQLTKDLDIQILTDAILDNVNEPGGTQDRVFMFKSMWMQIPTLSVYANDNPQYLNNQVADGTHPLAITSKAISGYIKTQNKSYQGTFSLNYKIPFTEGLKATALFSRYSYDIDKKTYKKKYPLYNYNATTDTYTAVYQQSPSYVERYYRTRHKDLLQVSLNYENSFDKHNVKALALMEQRTEVSDNFNARRDLLLDELEEIFTGDPNTQRAGQSSSQTYELANVGVVGRVNYDYSSKYLFEFAFRYDASSKFPSNNRWGFFPSFFGGWRLSEENFFKGNVPFVDNLKIRGSWGKLGDEDASSFQYIEGFSYPSGSYVFDNGLTSGVGFKSLPNPNIFWYEAEMSNLGLDGDLFGNKLHAEFEVFRRYRTGLLANRLLTLPETVGASLPQENLNSDLTRGYEIALGYTAKFRNGQINISGNMANARTQNRKVERANPTGTYDDWRNNPQNRWDNIIWGYKTIGRFQNYDEIYNSPVQDGKGNKNLLPGDLKYLDLNKDGIIDSGDQTQIGRGNTATSGSDGSNADNDPGRFPEITYGFTISGKWKNFDLSMHFQGAAKFDVFYAGALQTPLRWGRNSLAIFNDRWRLSDVTDPNSEWIPGKYPAYRTASNSNYAMSDFWLNDASFLRLKSMEIGYTLPQNLSRKAGLDLVRIYANGFNLHTWTKIKFIDPEQTPRENSSLYPITRNFNLGVNISF